MSAKKSWDIAPKPKRQAAAAAAPAATKRTPVTLKQVERVTSMRRAPLKRETPEPLKKRRRKQRHILTIVLAIGGLLLVGGVCALVWQPYLRVTHVRVEGVPGTSIQEEVQRDLEGGLYMVIPRNSLFFVPEQRIRENILARHPEVQSVSLHVENLHTLVVEPHMRQDVFVWCGSAKEMPDTQCYKVDAEGMLFAATFQTATSSPLGTLVVYAPLNGMASDTPLTLSIVRPELLPTAFRFVKILRDMGMDITTLSIRGDEADLYSKAGTRLTYVLGREEAAAALVASALGNVHTNDGSVEYVDLRFENKVYVKKVGNASPE